MHSTINIPGVHLWKSKLSGQYFTAIQVKDDPETITNCIKFSMPEATDEVIKEIMNNTDLIESGYINFKTGDAIVHKLKIGSMLCKNMYGTLIDLGYEHFNSIMIPVSDKDKEDVIWKYFMCLVEVNFGSTYTKINYIIKTLKVYPSRKDIENGVIKFMKNEKSIEIDSSAIFIISITELTEAQYESYCG